MTLGPCAWIGCKREAEVEFYPESAEDGQARFCGPHYRAFLATGALAEQLRAEQDDEQPPF